LSKIPNKFIDLHLYSDTVIFYRYNHSIMMNYVFIHNLLCYILAITN